ncbi:MAG: A/G-specific adenine glycosylase [Acidobacteria bacterium]|nr:A/G-specific adenine glycosylase [Acidobacteriota bacterium]
MPADSTDAAPPPRFSVEAGDQLLRWYATERRDLPWRRTADPYSILVSELMLQQTRVEVVTPRYQRFLERFPTVAALAEAEVDEVLAEWSGLGYYRRARNLHAAAVAVQDMGEFPRSYAGLRELPGVGDYTAAAVAGIAFGAPHVGIDGNVIRVLCRYFAIADDPTRAATRRVLRAAAESLLNGQPPGDVTQALMELGARMCTPRSPTCGECAIRSGCAARADGSQALLPVRKQTKVHEAIEAAAVIEHDGSYLLTRGQRVGVLTEMWEFPTIDSRTAEPIVEETPPAVREERLRAYAHRLGVEPSPLRAAGTIRHGITNRRITCEIYAGNGTPTRAAHSDAPETGWFTPTEAAQIPLAASARRTFELLTVD